VIVAVMSVTFHRTKSHDAEEHATTDTSEPKTAGTADSHAGTDADEEPSLDSGDGTSLPERPEGGAHLTRE